MTAATLSRLPFSAGGSALGVLSRAGGWFLMQAGELALLLLRQFLRAPIAITTVAVIAGLSLLAGSNALFFQTERHPAPLFFAPPPRPAPAKVEAPRVVAPVVPAPRPHIAPALDTETTGGLGPAAPTPQVIGNEQVKALQQRLVAMKLLDDEPDGIFGRRTAAAIKAFETRAGMRADGKLTPDLLAAVLAASPAASPAQPAPALPAAHPSNDAIAELVAASAPAQASAAPALHAAPIIPVQPVPLAPLSPAKPAVSAPPVVAPNAVAPNAVAPNVVANAPAPTAAPLSGSTPAIAAATPPAAPASQVDSSPAAQPAGNLTAAQRLAQQMGTLPPQQAAATPAAATIVANTQPSPPDQQQAAIAVDDSNGSTDPVLISKIQRGLASLGFLGERIDGVPGEGTAKAIRNFEVFYDYKVTGLATHRLLDLLVQHGAVI